jgi:hypothetical protein
MSHNFLLIDFVNHKSEPYIGRNIARYWSVVTRIDSKLKILFSSSGHRYRTQDDYICPSIRLSFVFALISINIRPQFFFHAMKMLGDIVQLCFCSNICLYFSRKTQEYRSCILVSVLYLSIYRLSSPAIVR